MKFCKQLRKLFGPVLLFKLMKFSKTVLDYS